MPARVSDFAGDCRDGDATVEGAIPAVGPEGQVYVAWAGTYLTGARAPDIRFDRSLDGGVTWGEDVAVAVQPGGWNFAVSGIYRCNGLPTTLCDVSYSPYRGFVYVVWSDQRNGTSNTDVFLARSTDQGMTWSLPIRVNDDASGRHQFFPAATIDPTTGIIYVVYYDRRATTGDATDLYLSRSSDGGQTFQSVVVSDTPFTPDASVFFGDYIGIVARNQRIHPIWTRLDPTGMSVWTTSMTDSQATVGVPPSPTTLTLWRAFPNPLRTSTRLRYTLANGGPVSIRVMDVQGRQVASLVDGVEARGEHVVEWDARSAPVGIYFCALSAGGQTSRSKLIVVR